MSEILKQIISLDKFNNSKSNEQIEYICFYCKQIKNKKKSYISATIKENQKYMFCSNSCGARYNNRNLPQVTKKELEIMINKNMSTNDIAKITKKSQGSIRYWLKHYNLKTNFKFREGGWARKFNNKFDNINWEKIQEFYNSGKTWKDICRKFNISFNILSKATKTGLFKSRKAKETWLLRNPNRQGKKHSQNTKDKLSIARKEYLSNNPNAFAWKNKDKFKSIPCENVKNELKLLNIKFEEEFQPLLHIKRFFRIDISFIDKKIGFEINGGQHYDTNRNLKPYYQIRHNLIENEGWKIYEVPYHIAMRKEFVKDFIIPIINGLNPEYDLTLYQSKNGSSMPN